MCKKIQIVKSSEPDLTDLKSSDISFSKKIEILPFNKNHPNLSSAQISKVVMENPLLLLSLSEHFSYKELLDGIQPTSSIYFSESDYQNTRLFLPTLFRKVVVTQGYLKSENSTFIHGFIRGITDFGSTILRGMAENGMLPSELNLLYWTRVCYDEKLSDATYLLKSLGSKSTYKPSDFFGKIVNSKFPISFDVSRIPLNRIQNEDFIDYLIRNKQSTYLRITNEPFCAIPLKTLYWIP